MSASGGPTAMVPHNDGSPRTNIAGGNGRKISDRPGNGLGTGDPEGADISPKTTTPAASTATTPGTTAKPAPAAITPTPTPATPTTQSTQSTEPATPQTRTLSRASTTPLVSATSSTAGSPKASREGSPVRSATSKPNIPPGRAATRSRKNSTELSPHRMPNSAGPSIPTVPSAAAVQRALSAAGAPQFPAPSQHDITTDPSRLIRGGGVGGGGGGAGGGGGGAVPGGGGTGSGGGKTAPVSTSRAGPSNPRVNSPPPAAASASPGGKKVPTGLPRRTEQLQSTPATSSGVADRSTRSPAITSTDATAEEDYFTKGTRTQPRGISGTGPMLETVQEASLPSTPASSSTTSTRNAQVGRGISGERPERIEENPLEDTLGQEAKPKPDSGNESSGTRGTDVKNNSDGKDTKKPPATSASKPMAIQSKKSMSQIPLKGKAAGEGSVKNMTVETETVSSIPQVALGGGAGERNLSGRADTTGGLRVKRSNETIRPKEKRKKAVRKAPSLHSGTASSKADIFEAKVASAVGEADSSDSEETFVYESNPPEPHLTRPHKFHSRTPSAASIVSQLDYHKSRPEGPHGLVGKKSMKFANNHTPSHLAIDGEGTVRGPAQTRLGSISHHHIGRHGREGRGSLPSLFDDDPSAPGGPKASGSATGQYSNTPLRQSPKSTHFFRVSGAQRKTGENSSYDLEGEGADDETTPLVGSIRSNRRRRPMPGGVRNLYIAKERRSRSCGRVTVLSVLACVLALLIAAIIVILIMCSKPLLEVHIRDIRNVLASESELMLDLHVHAVNPNLVAVQISDLDVNIFAKSKHVTTMDHWQSLRTYVPRNSRRSSRQPEEHSTVNPPDLNNLPIISTPKDIVSYLPEGGVDEGTDPMDPDPITDSQTMLLGQIFSFDSPLSFDPSPFRHQWVSSVGEVRLAKPGNHTEEGGSKRWDRVLLYDFELIVRGVFRYSPPVSSMTRSVTVHANVIVHPNEESSDGNSGLSPADPADGVDPGSKVIVERPPLITAGL